MLLWFWFKFREVWPQSDCFGSSDAAPEDELLLLRDIFMTDLKSGKCRRIFVCNILSWFLPSTSWFMYPLFSVYMHQMRKYDQHHKLFSSHVYQKFIIETLLHFKWRFTLDIWAFSSNWWIDSEREFIEKICAFSSEWFVLDPHVILIKYLILHVAIFSNLVVVVFFLLLHMTRLLTHRKKTVAISPIQFIT